MLKKTDGRRNVEVSNVEQEDSEKLPRLALFPLAVPGDGLSPAVPLAVRPRYAFLADPAALAVGVDGAAEDVAPLAVLAVPAEVAAVLALAAHGPRGDLVGGDLVPAVGGAGAEDGGEEQEEAGGGGHGAGVRAGVPAIKSLSALDSCGSALPATTAPACFVNTQALGSGGGGQSLGFFTFYIVQGS